MEITIKTVETRNVNICGVCHTVCIFEFIGTDGSKVMRWVRDDDPFLKYYQSGSITIPNDIWRMNVAEYNAVLKQNRI